MLSDPVCAAAKYGFSTIPAKRVAKAMDMVNARGARVILRYAAREGIRDLQARENKLNAPQPKRLGET
jgi:hypothetical protein